MIKRFFILLLAIVASVGMSWALPTVKYAVCNVPDGWTVTANGDAVSPINGRYHIADGQTVVLTPPASPEVGSVTSAEETGLLGTGTAEDPYLIYTVAHWNAVAAKVNDGTQAAPYCLQMANLDGVTTVMGNSESNPFKGIYDGNGFVFTNINLSITSGSNPLGLFGCVNDASAVVKNVVVAGGTVSSTSRNVGAIVGQLNGGTVQYCANYATVSSSFDGAVRMGGIVGWMRSAGGDNNRVDHCINYGNVSGVAYVGGITGSCGAGYVSYCQNYGSISSSSTSNEIKGSAGGIIGWYNPTTDASQITYNHNGGHITEAVVSGYEPSRYIIANTNNLNIPASNSYLSSLTLTIGSDSYTEAQLATHEPSAQALDINPEGITISGITYAYGVAAPIAPAPGTNPGTDPAQQSNKTWQFTMPSHNIGLTVIIYPAEVIAKINNIPLPVELTLATRDSIQAARAAYEALNAAQQALVTNYQTLLDAEAALAAYIYIPDGALNGKFTINAAGDVISFAKGNLQATTTDLGEHWTWGLAANQWEVIGGEVANTAITGSGTVSENGTVDLFGWSTPATYFGIYHTMDGTDYLGDFVDWGTNMGAGWRTLSIAEWEYLLKTRDNAANLRGQATVNGVYGLILLPNDWTLPAGLTFTAMPNNWTTNVYADADWTAMEEAGAVFLPIEGLRWEQTLYYADEGNYWSSTPAENYQSAEYVLVREETQILGGEEYLTDYGGRDNGISVRLAAVSVNPFDDAQAVKDMIDALPNPIDYFSKDAIKAARDAYDALADETKAALDEATVQHLIDAENQWAAIAAKIEQNVYYIGKDGELKNEKVALLNIPDPAPDFNGYEFDKWKVKTGRFLEEGLRIKALYTPIITTDPVAYDTLVFNRANQELVVAGIAEEGHIEYRIGEGEWSAELPKAMNAGTYEVTYKLVRDGHDDYISPNQISVTIAKTQVAFDAPAAYDTLTYNYNAQTLIAAGQTLDGTFEYTLDPTDAQSWSTELPQGMNAGLYGVNYRVIGDMNHFDSIIPTPIEILIAKRDIIVTAPAAYDTLVYNAQEQTLAIDGTADFNTMEYTLTPNDDNSWLTVMPTAKNAGSYDVYYRVPGDANHNDYEPQHIAATIAQAPLTITAIDSTIIYGDEAPEFFATYSGWQGEDNEEVVSGLAYTCAYEQGSYVGTYAITPNSATALNYAMTFVEGTLTVVKAAVYVSDAEVHIAKFEDNNTDAEVTDKGVLNGVKLNDPVDHITTASFSSADVAEHLTITLFYELAGDSALLENYYLTVPSEVYTEEGVIIEQILPDNDHQPGETEQVEVKEGIDVYMFGYCDGSGYSVKYHLNRGIPDQYMIDFEDSRFTDVDWTNLETPGKDGTIFVEIPVDLPTGDYNMSVQFRDSRFDWLESRQFDVTFHVNLPETYTMPLFGNAIALVDTCECFTDIQWYYRASSNDVWEPIPGATGYYCHVDGQLTGEYFVAAKMNGVETFTCPQTDMETLYEDDIQHVRVRAYPNPVIDKTNVVIEHSIEWNHNLRIVNLMGVEMMTTTFEGNETSVEMGNYPQGNYMISVDGNVVKVMKK